MKAKWIKKSLCLLLCLGMAGIALAQRNTPSILERVQRVDDPELGELIRLAKENRRVTNEKDAVEIMHKVTLSYVQIKLFDQQIAEVSRKIKAATGPAEMQYELLLAKAELESKLMVELANLRETMGITPRHPFDKKPLEILNTWLHLHVLDEGVHVLDSLRPYEECWVWWGFWRLKSSGLLPERKALDFVRERLQNKTNLPIRIDLHHTAAMRSSAEDLRRKIISLIREANCQMEAEVNLKLLIRVGSGESTFFIRGGTISTLYTIGKIRRPDGGSKPIVTGVVEPNDLNQHILWRLMLPGNIPLKYRIEHDETSAKLARQTADRIRAIAKDLGIGEVVDVERILVESVPETAFLGRWQAITRGDVQTINVQPTGVCVFEMSDRFTLRTTTGAIKPGASVPGRWFLTPKEIFMDIKDYQDNYYVYRGHFDKQGNLVVVAGVIYPQGSFHYGTERIVVFKKVY